MTNLEIGILTLNDIMSQYENKAYSEVLRQSDFMTISVVSFITDLFVKKKKSLILTIQGEIVPSVTHFRLLKGIQ